MRTISTLIVILILGLGVSGQTVAPSSDIEATTDDGRVVILKADGTWTFKPEPKIKPLGVTAAGFAAVKEGMSYETVVAILGRDGDLVSESTFGATTTKMYSWKGGKTASLGASMNAIFQDDKMKSKSQFGLK